VDIHAKLPRQQPQFSLSVWPVSKSYQEAVVLRNVAPPQKSNGSSAYVVSLAIEPRNTTHAEESNHGSADDG
jgi:hypothetical protein